MDHYCMKGNVAYLTQLPFVPPFFYKRNISPIVIPQIAESIPLKSTNKQKRKKSANIPKVGAEKFRTELCKNFEISGTCRYGLKCDYAHGNQDLRKKSFSNLPFKMKKCNQFFTQGYCSYGIRCQFSHEIACNLSYSHMSLLFSLLVAEEPSRRLKVFDELTTL